MVTRSSLAQDDACGMPVAARIVGGQDAKLGQVKKYQQEGKTSGERFPVFICSLQFGSYKLGKVNKETENSKAFDANKNKSSTQKSVTYPKD